MKGQPDSYRVTAPAGRCVEKVQNLAGERRQHRLVMSAMGEGLGKPTAINTVILLPADLWANDTVTP